MVLQEYFIAQDILKAGDGAFTKDAAIEMKILTLIKENASITTTEMARLLAVNRRTIQRGLDVLKRTGTIERKGGKRFGHWEVYE